MNALRYLLLFSLFLSSEKTFSAGITNVVRNFGFVGFVSTSDWQRAGNFYADSRFATSNSTPGYAYLSASDGSPANSIWGTLSQTTTIPSFASETSLMFWYRITSTDVNSRADSLTVTLRTPSGALLKHITNLYNQNLNTTYTIVEKYVSEYAGQTVTIHFAATNNSSFPTVFRIDDVLLLSVIPDVDTIKPTITKFEPNTTQLQEGGTVTFNFTVADAGGSGLKQAVLFRNDHSDGEFDTHWEIISRKNLSGNGPLNNTFTDSPPIGDHWYGLHVVDNANNEIDEREAGFGPDKVTVIPLRRFAISASAEPLQGGEVHLEPPPEGDGKYSEGSRVQVTGTANNGYNFLLWTGDATGTWNPFELTLTRDTTLGAVFERADTHPPFSIFPIATAQAATFSSTVQTRSTWSYIVEYTVGLGRWFKLVLLRGDDDAKTFTDPDAGLNMCRLYRIGTIPSDDTGVRLKLPLPGGKSWLLTTEIGNGGCSASDPPLPSHTGINHYSIDLDNWSRIGNGTPTSETDVPVLAAGGGLVVTVDYQAIGNGHCVVIDHDFDGNLETGYSTRYLHLKETPLVVENQTVTNAQPIGIMGGSGGWPIHLHFGVRYANDGGLGIEAKEALQKVRLEEQTLDQYKVECAGDARLRYYPSSQP